MDNLNRKAALEIYDPKSNTYSEYEVLIRLGNITPVDRWSDLVNMLINGGIMNRIMVSMQEAKDIAFNCYRLFHQTIGKTYHEWHVPIIIIDGQEFYCPNSSVFLKFTAFNDTVDFIRYVHIEQLGVTR